MSKGRAHDAIDRLGASARLRFSEMGHGFEGLTGPAGAQPVHELAEGSESADSNGRFDQPPDLQRQQIV